MLLVGSQALKYYLELNRPLHDWDIWMDKEEYHTFLSSFPNAKLIKATANCHLFQLDEYIIEIKLPIHRYAWTDGTIFLKQFETKITTPIGLANLPDIQTLHDMKASTANWIKEPKHEYDLNLMRAGYPDLHLNSILYIRRDEETKERVALEKAVKYDFFHKYHIPEYIDHDYMHEMIADLVDISMPTYQRITTAEVSISEELFDKLTHNEKLSLMAEESLVLALERWFVPQMVENGINYTLLPMFKDNNEGLPTYQILKHCCITGLKGEAEYIVQFARDNFFAIEKLWIEYKRRIEEKNGLPTTFYDKLFKLRDRYKAGEDVKVI